MELFIKLLVKLLVEFKELEVLNTLRLSVEVLIKVLLEVLADVAVDVADRTELVWMELV